MKFNVKFTEHASKMCCFCLEPGMSTVKTIKRKTEVGLDETVIKQEDELSGFDYCIAFTVSNKENII